MESRFVNMLVLALALAGIGAVPWLSAQDKGKKEAVADKDREQLLRTVGALSAGQLYQTYLNIGFMADGKAEGVYEEKDIQQIMGSVVSLMDTLDKELEKVAKLDLTKEDREAVDQFKKLSGLLRTQADELQAFWKTGDKDRGAKYEKVRQEAWQGISKLLDLK